MDEVVIRDEGGFGFGVADDQVTISYRGHTVTTTGLAAAVRSLHATIRSVVDPLAELDVHGQDPIVPRYLAGKAPPGTPESTP